MGATTVPEAVASVASHLRAGGFDAWVVGESALALARGRLPIAFELSTNAPPEHLLARLESAVPTHPHRAIATVPSAAGPVDVVSRRHDSLEEELAQRDFTVLALAIEASAESDASPRDPHGGLEDLQARRLRAVGDPAGCLSADPLRALRAARLVADLGLDVDPALACALGEIAGRVGDLPHFRARRELVHLLLSPGAGAGLALLRKTGIEATFVPDVRADAAPLVEALPRSVPLRLAGWLRGTHPAGFLRKLRFGVPLSLHVEQLLEHHPLDERVDPTRDRALHRLEDRLDPGDREALFLMREWELDRDDDGERRARASRRLERIRAGLLRIRANREQSLHRAALAIDGSTVMEILGCEPGREVGAALRFLAGRVADDPDRNTPEALRTELLSWSAESAG